MTDFGVLRSLAEKVTPGPWHNEFGGLHDGPWVGAEGSTPTSLLFVAETANHPDGLNDAAFIGACDPQTVLSLLDELGRTTKELDDLYDWLEGAGYRREPVGEPPKGT